MHQKVFVVTYHNILSFHAAKDQQQAPGGCPSDHNTTCLFFFIDIWQKIFFFVNVDIVLVCRRPRQLPPMSVQIFTSNLEPINPSLDKITQRYVLKPNILILAYYHSKLWRTDSKCLADARVCRITIQFFLFLFIDVSSLMFDIVLVCKRPSHLPPMSVQIFIPCWTSPGNLQSAMLLRRGRSAG